MAPKMCNRGPRMTCGYKGHLVIVLLLLVVHYVMVVLGVCSGVSWIRGLTAYGLMISKVPSELPTMLWLLKLIYVYTALFTCVIGAMLCGVCTKNGRLIRVTAAVQFVLVAVHLAYSISTAAFYAEFLRPKLESSDVLIETAARYNESFYSVQSYAKVSKQSSQNSYRLVYVSDTDWFLRFYCGKVYRPDAPASKTHFEAWQIDGCDDESFMDALTRLAYNVFTLPTILVTGAFIAILSAQQASFFLRPEERLGCEKSRYLSPSVLNVECGSFFIKFETPFDIAQVRAATQAAATTEEGEKLETEQAQSSNV